MALDAHRVAAERARHRADVDTVDPRPRAGRAAALGQPVHDRVAAVGEHDEQHADAVAGRAPQGLDLVERRAVADHGQHRPVGARHPQPDRGRQGEAEHAHGAHEPERRGRGHARVQLGAAGGRLLDEDRVARQALGEGGEHVAGAERLAVGGRGRGRRAAERLAGDLTLVDLRGQRGADGGGVAEHGELDGAAVRLLGVLGDDRHPRARARQRPGIERVLAQRAGADHEHDVVGGEHLAQPRATGGQVAGEPRMVLREAGLAAERLLEHRAGEPLGERCEGGPAGAGAGHDRGRRCLRQQVGERLDRRGVRGGGPQEPLRPEDLVRLGRGREPVVHRHDDDRRPAAGHRLVVGADDRARHVLRAGRLVAPHRVLARQASQAARQERVEREVAAVLLADDHHQRRAVGAGGRDGGDRVAEPGRRVQQGERGRAAADRVAGRHRHHRALVETEHEGEVVRQAGQERDLGRARVGEDRGQLEAPQHLEGRIAHRRLCHPAYPTAKRLVI